MGSRCLRLCSSPVGYVKNFGVQQEQPGEATRGPSFPESSSLFLAQAGDFDEVIPGSSVLSLGLEACHLEHTPLWSELWVSLLDP